MEEQNILETYIKEKEIVNNRINYPANNAKNQRNKYNIESDFICFT